MCVVCCRCLLLFVVCLLFDRSLSSLVVVGGCVLFGVRWCGSVVCSVCWFGGCCWLWLMYDCCLLLLLVVSCLVCVD